MLLCLRISFSAFSQVGIAAYFADVIGINTSKEKMISGELKARLNSSLYDTAFELSGMYNFKAGNYHRFSVGLGVVFSPFQDKDPYNAISMPLQLEVFPMQNFKHLSFVMEVAPLWTADSEAAFRYLLGIRYTFKN
jgi:hypothetical protein